MKNKHKAELRYASNTDKLDGHAVVLWKRDSLHRLNRGDPLYLLPATTDAYNEQVEAMMKKMWQAGCGPDVQGLNWKALAEVGLAAIGIKRPNEN